MKKMFDSFNRPISYFRISLTDRCNFRCLYCSPSEKEFCFIPHDNILRYEEILEIARVAVKIGMTKIRLTGGEPLVRKGLVNFISRLSSIEGLEDISMTTNGFLLNEIAYSLKQAGLNRVNISLDSLQKEKFKEITGVDGLGKVLKGIERALEEELTPVKINVVLLKGINLDEVDDFIQMSTQKPLYVRFIELMPTNHQLVRINQGNFISAQLIQEKIKKIYSGLKESTMEKGYGPAVYYSLPGAKGMFGFITAVSQHFCASCNRIRLTAEGNLRPCLFSPQEIKIKETLRNIPIQKVKEREEFIQECLIEAIRIKPLEHTIGEKKMSDFDMSKIGG